MTSEEGLRFFSSLQAFGVRMGLERIERALGALGHPERQYRALHVAGTNGKGSTCAFAASCLAAQGYRVGLYTSPHLNRVNERIQISGQAISDSALGKRILEVLERYPDAASTPRPLTFFEFGTLVALWHFAQEKVDLAVLETGLGGRLDATSTAQPAVTAVTPISFDHTEYLGHSLSAIASEKAGIFKPGVPIVLSRQPSEALTVLLETARRLASPVLTEGRDFHLTRERDGSLSYRGARSRATDLRLALRGAHQVQNAAVAIACLELLADAGFPVSPANLRAGLAGAQWPGRLEELGGQPPVLLDGAHNPAGIEALVAALHELYPGRRIHAVFGVLADKDYRAMIQRLFPLCTSIHLSPVSSSRALAPEQYLNESKQLCADARAHATAADALRAARRKATRGADLVLCTGSLFLVGAIRALVGELSK
jgi:dihydrofolate synthase/folylpolyglutamate synthase